MPQEITTIEFPMKLGPMDWGTTNCYLVKTGAGYVLIDTAYSTKRADLDKELENAGCQPGNLDLIVITHGDLDHTGNGAYLREKYSVQDHPVKIAMHRYDAGVVENGDDTLSRRKQPWWIRLIGGIILKTLALLIHFGTFERFKPDFYLDEGDDLSRYGFDAKILHLPGHSRGSIGILTAQCDLFCGDLFWNMSKPSLHSIVDDAAEMQASAERLKILGVKTIYPGHGKPFLMEELTSPPLDAKSFA